MENWTANAAVQAATEALLERIAEQAGFKLSTGGNAIDVVQFIVKCLEDHEGFNAGKGSAVNEVGGHELEAAIVGGHKGSYGAVACSKTVKNPIEAARLLLDSDKLCILVGEAADTYAHQAGLDIVDNTHFTTTKRMDHLENWKAGHSVQAENLGTVGAIALDIHGNLAAAGSTGGKTGKPLGRIGDTAIIGAGLIVNKHVAVACSGHGEAILESNVAATVSSLVASKVPLESAVDTAIQQVSQQSDGMPCAILAMDHRGKLYSSSTGRIFSTASSTSLTPARSSMAETTVPILEQHVFYADGVLRAGLTRYPTVHGQCVIELRNCKEISTLDLRILLHVFKIIAKIELALRHAIGSSKCGIVSRGGSTISLLPFEIQKDDCTHGQKQHDRGHTRRASIDARLGRIHAKITSTSLSLANGHVPKSPQSSGLHEDYHSWLIWESDSYAAFLSPEGSVRGECNLRQKAHADKPESSFDAKNIWGFVQAIQAVIELLQTSLGVTHCGINIDPLADSNGSIILILQPISMMKAVPSPAPFHKSYPGYVTSQLGPLSKNKREMLELVDTIRAFFKPTTVKPPGSWKDPLAHSLQALNHPWYQAMFELQDTFYHACITFFRTEMGFDYVLSPLTSDCISSPVGLGSDSSPVRISLFDRDTYLADSMQFALEYMLRLKEGTKGTYYVSSSFRGEDPDSSHLNQFFHVECELEGGMDKGMEVMEKFVVSVAGTLLEKHRSLITSIAGDTSHITDLLDFAASPGVRFPRMTFAEAMEICGADTEAWEYVVPEAPALGKKLTRKGERAIMKQHGGVVWLTNMSHLSVPFYQAYSDKEHKNALCGDLLMGIGEMGGLGERHKTADDVKAALTQHGVPLDTYKWYIDLRDYKPIQSVGWGVGMERFMLWLLKHDDVRDIAVIPRLKTGAYLP
ncbi:uncharacterized protein KY384_005675 [Bacidia gigantensis]|uniref:uncharacterized protein n=1 Tax=Bacidia gigantensis TaxID=2732470 RepID=UPI001D0572A3|nr:uncharacterized protein KY384_005675 [Bacidia gigantensis]KAG8529041.1 hypothetical protein KY384_005675 [Bacidia gigantensis]